jgi:hypothetical protein
VKQAIILGGGAKARCIDLSIIDEPDVEIWDVNFIHAHKDWVGTVIPRIDAVFNIHKYDLLKKYGYPTWRDASWARDHRRGTEIYLADKWPDERIAHAQIFPAAELREVYPRGDYHCNSCDWLIAYALYCGFKEVRLHGFNLEREGLMEQLSAAKCAEYWAGFATGKGMEVIVEKDSAMFGVYHPIKTNRVYGYDDCPAFEDKTPEGTDPPYRYDDY